MNTIPPNYVQNAKGEWCHPSRAHQNGPQQHANGPTTHSDTKTTIKTPKRIKQRSKPLLNALEQEWLSVNQAAFHEPIMSQSVAFRLGNGVVYWPDFVSKSFTHAWEIKGNKPLQDDSVVKIKVAARLYPQIKWRLAWKKDGIWVYQEVYW